MRQLRKPLSLLCALVLMLVCMCVPALAEEAAFAGGSGTAEDPWQIATVEQLAYLASTVNDGSQSGYPGTLIYDGRGMDGRSYISFRVWIVCFRARHTLRRA